MHEFRMLGPVEVADEHGKLIQLRPKQRALLALLIIHANEAVSTDRIIDSLWSNNPPGRPGDTVRFHVSGLRKALQPEAPRDLIETVTGGYVLRVDISEATDVGRFHWLTTRASAETAASAAQTLRDALDIWRGPAYGGLDYEDFALAEIASLEEERLVALERRVAADLDNGDEEPILGELTGLVHKHPLRERLHGFLMIAQYRLGRQADALRTYRMARSILGEELGIEPGSELRSIEDKILLQDPGLGSPTEVPPSTVPAEISSFVGRRAESTALLETLKHSRLVVVRGPGGIGKTRLATAVARQIDQLADQDVVYVELERLRDSDLVLRQIAIAADVAPGSPGVIQKELRKAWGTRDTLAVLDNCEHLREAVAATAQALLRQIPTLRILATSRSTLGIPGEVVFDLLPLGLDPVGAGSDAGASEAMLLFEERSQIDFTSDVNVSSTVAEICGILDGVPLAIELAAARLKVLPLDDLATRVREKVGSVGRGPEAGPARHATLESTMDWSYELLNSRERAFLRRLSVFRGSFDLEAAELIALPRSDGGDDVLDYMDRMVAHSLVYRPDRSLPRFKLLEPTRQYAAERLVEDGESDLHHRKHAEYFLVQARRLSGAIGNSRERPATTLFVLDKDNYRAALDRMLADQRGDLAVDLAAETSWFFLHTGAIPEAEQRFGDVLRMTEGEPSRSRCVVLASLVYVQLMSGNLEEASRLNATLGEEAKSIDDPLGRAYHHERTAELLWQSLNRESALDHLRLAAELFADLEHHELLLVRVYQGLGQAAMGLAAQAREVADALERSAAPYNSAHATAFAQQIRARAAFDESDHEAAMRHATFARDQFLSLGLTPNVAGCRIWIARPATFSGQYELAEVELDLAISEALALGEDLDAARARTSMARVAFLQGDTARALELLQASMAAVGAAGLANELAHNVLAYAEVAVSSGQYTEAARLLGGLFGLEVTGGGLSGPYRALVADLLAEIEGELGVDVATRSLDHGKTMSPADLSGLAAAVGPVPLR